MCGAERKGSMAKYLQTSVGTQAASPSWEKMLCSMYWQRTREDRVTHFNMLKLIKHNGEW